MLTFSLVVSGHMLALPVALEAARLILGFEASRWQPAGSGGVELHEGCSTDPQRIVVVAAGEAAGHDLLTSGISAPCADFTRPSRRATRCRRRLSMS